MIIFLKLSFTCSRLLQAHGGAQTLTIICFTDHLNKKLKKISKDKKKKKKKKRSSTLDKQPELFFFFFWADKHYINWQNMQVNSWTIAFNTICFGFTSRRLEAKLSSMEDSGIEVWVLCSVSCWWRKRWLPLSHTQNKAPPLERVALQTSHCTSKQQKYKHTPRDQTHSHCYIATTVHLVWIWVKKSLDVISIIELNWISRFLVTVENTRRILNMNMEKYVVLQVENSKMFSPKP